LCPLAVGIVAVLVLVVAVVGVLLPIASAIL